ncbi:5-formyltetrahydrofolate cyclo-ligase [Salipaludibacillus sp. HK11]|uniref:5-formyltetrahydrofolate cyclo-ligase n=1 Tax=Salipaludibacillus sp. HK11 TaxID=3394320 RepID=UPI0039FC3123
MSKTDLREKVKKEISALEKVVKERYLQRIYSTLFSHENWIKSDTIGVTISVGNEIATESIIRQAWLEGKQVLVPKCDSSNKTMTFYLLENFDQLENSFYGLKEPNPTRSQIHRPDSIDWMIVPGVVFDQLGYRIGQGGGYYDRFLASYPLSTVSVCYPLQLVRDLPHERHDIPVDFILTPDQEIQTKKTRTHKQ